MLQNIAIWTLPVLFAITVHEVAHGWMAKQRGDKTAEMMGRLTLNPIKHIDPIGTVLLPLTLLILQAGFVFGWAKPVPVTFANLRDPKTDMVWVALAGPASNGLMALFWLAIVGVGMALLTTFPWAAKPLIYMGQAGVLVNIVLLVLNMLPVPPLDGGRIVSGLLPNKLSWKFDRLEPYGFFILIGLLALGLLGEILGPVVGFLNNVLLSFVLF